MEIVLCGDELKSIEDFHKEIKRLLNFPDYYGNNLDALWDCLTGWVETPLTVVWKNFGMSKVYFGDFAQRALTLLKDVENEVSGFKVIVAD